jgi:phage shock protein PspC (stress-responsive transcriptional regulator)
MNRRLYRSRTDTVIAGVAAGLANYLNADPALVRIAWAILVPLTGGAALLAYIVAWIVVPEEPRGVAPLVSPGEAGSADMPDASVATGDQPTSAWAPPEPIHRERGSGNAALVVGAGLVVVGLWFLLREYLPDFDWGLVWPIVIVGIGVLILVSGTRRST